MLVESRALSGWSAASYMPASLCVKLSLKQNAQQDNKTINNRYTWSEILEMFKNYEMFIFASLKGAHHKQQIML